MILTREQFLAAVHRPGAFQRVEWESDATRDASAVAKRSGVTLAKITSATVRTGIDYANTADVAGRDVEPLPWGDWAVFPYVITHKGADYARLYLVEGSARTRYYVSGEQVTRDEYLTHVIPSRRESKRPTSGTVTVKLANIRTLS